MTRPTFQFHNIRLDNGRHTIDDAPERIIENAPPFQGARRILEFVYGCADTYRFSIADLGCLEGGYTVGFARMGFHSVGIEVRQINYDACKYVKQNINLPNLHFHKDSVWNLDKYGTFDAIYCGGLLYHLDRPKAFLEYIAPLTRRILLLHTHFAPDSDDMETSLSDRSLSPLVENEGLSGRWYTEYEAGAQTSEIEEMLRASYENAKSFWLQKPYLLQTLKDVGFDMVFESYDFLGSNIASVMLDKGGGGGFYRKYRGLFVGIKTDGAQPSVPAATMARTPARGRAVVRALARAIGLPPPLRKR